MLEEKHWYQSKTIWGSLLAVAASVFGAMGVSIDTSIQSDLSDAFIQLIGAIGAITAIYGRFSATQVIS